MRAAGRQLVFPDSHLSVATVATLESRMAPLEWLKERSWRFETTHEKDYWVTGNLRDGGNAFIAGIREQRTAAA